MSDNSDTDKVHVAINDQLKTLKVQNPMTMDDMKNAYSIIFSNIFGTPEPQPSVNTKATRSVPEYAHIRTDESVYDPETGEYVSTDDTTVSKRERQFIIYDCSFGHFTLFNIRAINEEKTAFAFSMSHDGKNYKMVYYTTPQQIANPATATAPATTQTTKLINYTDPELVENMIKKRNVMNDPDTTDGLNKRWNDVIVDKIGKICNSIKNMQ